MSRWPILLAVVGAVAYLARGVLAPLVIAAGSNSGSTAGGTRRTRQPS